MDYTVKALQQALQSKQISSLELTTHYLKKMAKHQTLNAFISQDEEHALAQARSADQALKAGQAKALTGIPMAHKDLFCTTHLPTTCASKMLQHFQSPYEATIVEKLREQGSIMLGKTNMDEFAMGSSNENSFFGPVKNPWDTSCVPGGSSGGSAAVVAAGLVPFATGSDTGGSIRQPAAFCGISGIKPSYGLVSRWGMVAYASSLDQAGPMARTAEDLALVLQGMAGFDPKDSTSFNQALPDYEKTLNKPIKGLKLGLPSYSFHDGVDPAIQNAIHAAAKQFEQAGVTIVPVEIKLQPLWVPCYYVIACAEASSNLSRYDGVRFGHRAKNESSIRDLVTASRNEGFGEEVKLRILTGTHVLSSGFFDAYYTQALKIRRLIQDELLKIMQQVDLILSPTTPTTAFGIGRETKDPMQNYLTDVFTVSANLAGLPAISIPAGFDDHLPIGLQLIGTPFSEALLLNVAHQFQQMTQWHQALPQGFED